MDERAIKYFWKRVEKKESCWHWVGPLGRTGYGCAWMKYIPLRTSAHRLSWMIHNGPIPPGEGYHGTCVLHKCDNPPCVNPEHLFLGTAADNATDKTRKGRTPHGVNHHKTKLKPADVLAIRESKLSNYRLGMAFRVNPMAIKQIKQGTSWKHLK